MFSKKHISFLIICLIFALLMSGCRETVDYSSSPVIPGGEDFTDTSENSDSTSSDETASQPEQSSQETPAAPSSSVSPSASSTASHLHAFRITRVEPTCTTDGYTLYECSCGETKIGDYISKKGHSWSEWTTVSEPTTVSAGLKERVCTVCGEKETQEIAMTDAPDYAALQREILKLVNEERIKAGKTALSYRGDLQVCADIRSEEIIEKFDRTRPNGEDCFSVLAENNITNYLAFGENIAKAQSTPQAVMESWMNLEGHKANILSDEFTGIAVGVTVKNGIYYWVQIFIK